ncbi:MAG: beta-N-acetylhexosaminidase [Fimbriimonas sp.]
MLTAVAMLALTQTQLALIPQPANVTLGAGSFTLSRATVIETSRDTRAVGEMLREKVRPATGLPLEFGASRENAIRLSIDRKLSPEAYRLTVTSNGIDIAGGQRAGVFYGTQTLLQLLPPSIFRKSLVDGVRWTVPQVQLEDAPRFSWRGSLVDVSRHFMPKEALLKYLDLLAFHKMNVFHWHLTDDMGWRVEIKKYPRLTEIATTDFSEMIPDQATRSINQRPGGFYSQEDVKEIVRYAAERNITIVPEIELPGHAYGAIKAYPELGNNAQIAAAGGDTKFNGMDNVFNVDDKTIGFLKDVLDEVVTLFPSKFIHIGGDEVWKDPWKNNPRAQAKKKELGLKTEEELQSWFIRQFDAYLVSKGRRLIGWDEILEGGLAPNAAVMSWRGVSGGIEAARAGHDVVMAPTSHTYLDYYQGKFRAFEPKAIGGYVSLEQVYSFEPVPPELNEAEARHILGAQGQLWTEFIPHPKHLEYMAYPRLTALSEVTWSPKTAKNWPDFQRRLNTHLERLRILDVNFRPLGENKPDPAASWKSGEIGEQIVEKEWDVTGKIKRAGSFRVLFLYTSGDHRLNIQGVQLLEDGKMISADDHEGFTGHNDIKNTFKLTAPTLKATSKYSIKAKVRADGGSDSNGDIYLLPERPDDWL